MIICKLAYIWNQMKNNKESVYEFIYDKHLMGNIKCLLKFEYTTSL